MLKWSRENNCPWSKLICSAATLGAHFEILRWEREKMDALGMSGHVRMQLREDI